jgi:hypothetical protein
MSKKIDLRRLRENSVRELHLAVQRYEASQGMHYGWRRWIARMTAVEIHSTWERYVETRLVAALNHSPKHFLEQHNITGVTAISPGFARYIIRGGRRFFDSRSTADLIDKANRWLGRTSNPFKSLSEKDRSFIDCLTAIRNYVVHGSEASVAAYKLHLKKVYDIRSAPGPDEFLHAKDSWTPSPARYKSRLHVIAEIIERTIQNT